MKGNAKGLENIVGKVKEILKIDTSLTKSGYAADAKVVGDKIAEIGTDRLGAEDIVNDLESEAADKPLSAAMGKVLRQLIGSSGGGSSVASDVAYDNSESGLDANDVQRAITLLTSMARNALPLEGGTLTGENIYMDSGRTRIQGNENAMLMQALNGIMDNDNRRVISLYNSQYEPNAQNALMLDDIKSGKKASYAIYGAHNMRKGSYKKETDTTGTFTFNTKSVGNVAMVIGVGTSSGLIAAFLSNAGALVFKNGSFEIVDALKASYSAGVITIYDYSILKETGVTYYYNIL